MPKEELIRGDCVEEMRKMPENSVDAIVTDPPYGLEFMGKGWDKLAKPKPGNIGGFADGNKPSWERVKHHLRGMEQWHYQWAVEAFRVLKPGGHMFVAGISRTHHRMMCAVEDAGFEIRDCVCHVFGSGFPKSLDVGKAIDKMARGYPQGGSDPESPQHGKYKTQLSEGKRSDSDKGQQYGSGFQWTQNREWNSNHSPATEAAKEWDGWGTALKPAYEFWLLARKLLSEPNVASNVLKWGTGGINVDVSRIGTERISIHGYHGNSYSHSYKEKGTVPKLDEYRTTQGRFPSNFLLSHHPECVRKGEKKVKIVGATAHKQSHKSKSDSTPFGFPHEHMGFKDSDGLETVEDWICHPDCPVRKLDEQSGELKSGGGIKKPVGRKGLSWKCSSNWRDSGFQEPSIGGASRFFKCFEPEVPFYYCAKASRRERNEGLEEMPKRKRFDGGIEGASIPLKGSPMPIESNFHPTVKPINLMRYLCRLIAPPGGVVLDPFMGSGSTGVACVKEGFGFIGIEKERDYFEIAERRMEHERKKPRKKSLGEYVK